jgi:hypothetical protein
MAKFSKDNQPVKNGRKAGGKNKRSQFSDTLTTSALGQLTAAVDSGESWAIQLVIARTHPALKPITPVNSLDGDLLAAKIKEVSEFEERLNALEQANET